MQIRSIEVLREGGVWQETPAMAGKKPLTNDQLTRLAAVLVYRIGRSSTNFGVRVHFHDAETVTYNKPLNAS